MEAKEAQAKAEAAAREAQVKAEAAAREAQAKAEAAVREARSKAEIEALKEQRNYATAMARLKVLEQAMSGSERNSISSSIVEVEDPLKRTKDYVLGQGSAHSITFYVPDHPEAPKYHAKNATAAPYMQDCTLPAHSPNPTACITEHQTKLQTSHQPTVNFTAPDQHVGKTSNSKPTPQLNAFAAPYFPTSLNDVTNITNSTIQPSTLFTKPETTDTTELVKYILRRELTKTGLTTFNDRPENYRSWKCAFRAAVHDLDIAAAEELNLLIKWLGPQSAERVRRLRSVYIDNPSAGLNAAWERLEQSFGSPEAIENALFK